MSDEQRRVFYAMIPNMAIDDLAPIELALYVYYVRVIGWQGGSCWQSARTIAAEMGIGKDTVAKHRDSLARKGWITATKRGRDTVIVSLANRWGENHERYAPDFDDDFFDDGNLDGYHGEHDTAFERWRSMSKGG